MPNGLIQLGIRLFESGILIPKISEVNNIAT
jgi:hypothetical protein